MERLAQLTAKRQSLDDLRELFRGMRAISAKHMQEAQTALAGIRRYVMAIEDAIAEGAMLLGDGAPPPEPAAGDGDSVLLVACSEHGFTGGFNERLLDRATQVRAPGETLAVIGTRGAVRAAERGLEVAETFQMATHAGGVLAAVRRVARRAAAATRLRVVHARYRRGGQDRIVVRPLLPLDPTLVAGPVRERRPLHHLDAAVLLARLADEYLFAEISRALTESFACENAARLRLMEAADHNIEERLGTLRQRELTLRQRQITTELLDVVIGAEAVLEDAGPDGAV